MVFEPLLCCLESFVLLPRVVVGEVGVGGGLGCRGGGCRCRCGRSGGRRSRGRLLLREMNRHLNVAQALLLIWYNVYNISYQQLPTFNCNDKFLTSGKVPHSAFYTLDTTDTKKENVPLIKSIYFLISSLYSIGTGFLNGLCFSVATYSASSSLPALNLSSLYFPSHCPPSVSCPRRMCPVDISTVFFSRFLPNAALQYKILSSHQMTLTHIQYTLKMFQQKLCSSKGDLTQVPTSVGATCILQKKIGHHGGLSEIWSAQENVLPTHTCVCSG